MSFRSITAYGSVALGAALLALSPLAAQETPPEQNTPPEQDTPPDHALGDFLQAADRNDFAAMKALLAEDLRWTDNEKITPDIFIERIGNCYLRRAYDREGPPADLIAAWMCDEGQGKSRVVLGSIAENTEGRILLAVGLEQKNDRPAPPRTGSAFAE